MTSTQELKSFDKSINEENPITTSVKLNGSSKKIINESVTSVFALSLKICLSSIGLVLSVILFRYAFHQKNDSINFRVWEDLYGRGLFFFLCSVVSYKYRQIRNDNISFFELEASYRLLFALRMASTCLSYGFLSLSLSQTKSMGPSIMMLCLSIPMARIFDSGTSFGNFCSFAVCLAGSLMLYSEQENSIKWYVYSLLSAFFFSVS